ncbi:MAG: hypothetical protein COA57_02450 [Flavobacteriales bacterium]|nr:MAG: hypothetical protein COA57_02450 [Flavobacteriales bacterium]
MSANIFGQTMLDNYDGVGDLTYTEEASGTVWNVNTTLDYYEGQTNSSSAPEHSYASYDLTGSIAGWNLNKANSNTWFGWMDLNRTSVSGWGGTNYSCGMVLASNNADFNSGSPAGYAVAFRNSPDELVLVKFSGNITSGSTNLWSGATELVSSGYTYTDGDNGVNFFVEFLSDGTWKISYIAGAQLSDANATNSANYTGGNATSANDETYVGTTYKYSGWIYAHSSSATAEARFDNFGAGQTSVDPVTNLVIINASSTSANITWTLPGGYNSANNSILVFVRASSAVTQGTPTNAPSTYTANTTFGSGTAYENDANAYCVYKGDGTSVTVTGLTAGTVYHVLVYNVEDAGPTYSVAAIANTRSLWEDVEAGSKTSYDVGSDGCLANDDVTLTAGSWRLCDVLRGTSGSDNFNGIAAMRAISSGTATMNFDLPNGAQTLTMYHAKYGTDNSTTWVLEKSVDAATSWIQVGSEITTSSTTLTQATFTVNEACAVRFRIRKTDGTASNRTNWDDIEVTNYTGTCIKDNYYRSTATGDWDNAATWEVSTDLAVWNPATNTPSAEAKTVTVRSPDKVTLQAGGPAITLDEITVDVGGTLEYQNTSGNITINNGTGVDLIVNGTFEDHDIQAGNAILFLTGATWQLGAAATMLKTNTGPSTIWRDNYQGGMTAIPDGSGGALWHLKKTGANTPGFSSTGGTFYPNLTLENTSGTAWSNGVGAKFVGASDFPTIKGNLDVGGAGSVSTVTLRTENRNATPVVVKGNTTIRSGHVMIIGDETGAPTGGTGFQFEGNVTVDGTLDYEATDATNTNRLLKFTNTSAQSVSGTGTLNVYNMEIDKSTNDVTLSRNVTVDNLLTLTAGDIISSSASRLTLETTATVSPSDANKKAGSATSFVSGIMDRKVNSSTTEYEFPMGHNGTGNWRPMTVKPRDATARTWTVEFKWSDGTVDYGTAIQANELITSMNSDYYHEITRAPVSGNADIKMFYEQSDITSWGITEADMVIGHWDGADWNNWSLNAAGDWVRDATNNWVQVLNANAFSPGGPGGGGGTTPIELLAFNAKYIAGKVHLDWATATEINNDFYTIERCQTNCNPNYPENWEIVITVDGAGNSNEELSYIAYDDDPYGGISYYRLKQTDFDGQFEYFDVVAVEIPAENETIINVYLNDGIVFVNVNSSEEKIFQIKITNVLGEKLVENNYVIQKGNNLISIDDLQSLPMQMLLISIMNESEKHTKKIIIEK